MNKGMVMKQPAVKRQDATPCGNGSIGAMMYGGICNDCILFNHERLYRHSVPPVLTPVSQHVDAYRGMLLKGEYSQGMDFFDEKFKDNVLGGDRPSPYQPFMDLLIHMDVRAPFSNYRRSLDFETGEAALRWEEEGAAYARRLFVSRDRDLAAMKIQSTAESGICADVGLCAHDGALNDPMNYAVQARGSKPWSHSQATGAQWIVFRGLGVDNVSFGAVARVITDGGRASYHDNTISVQNADSITILIKLFVDQDLDSAIARLKQELSTVPTDYEALLQDHIRLHSALYNASRADLLPAGRTDRRSNEQLLLDSYDGDVDTELIQTLYDYGHYLLLTSAGQLPPNLQGIWNGDYEPVWQSDFHNDENIQMNYWAALPTHLESTVLSYFAYYESMMDDYRENARAMFGCRGILVPIAQTTHGKVYSGGALWNTWTAGGGWLAQLFYDYWLFTGDDAFLRDRAVPFLREVALFYEDFLIERDGQYLFAPSLSPENSPLTENSSMACLNATMDVAICKEVLTNLCTACRHLGIEADSVAKWTAMLDKLPSYAVNEDGAFREWLYPGLEENYHQRHQSHIYPLFPGFEIQEETDPDLYKAIAVAVEKRLVIGLSSQSGWSFAHMANIYARLGNGNRALECIEILCRSCMGQNLFTYHNDWRSQGLTLGWFGQSPIFQIDANFGITAAIAEMLLFSKPGMIKLLPALPDKWKSGSVAHFRCRGGVDVSMEWDLEARTFSARLISTQDQTVTVKLPFIPSSFSIHGAAAEPSSYGDQYRMLSLTGTEEALIQMRG